MTEHDKIRLLRARLREIEGRPVTAESRAVLEIARASIETELSELGRRLARRSYWRSPRPLAG